MLRLILGAAVLQLVLSQQYQQKVAPGVPPQHYQNYQPPPPQQQPPQQQYQQQQQQQYQQPPPPQQQYQQPPPPQQVPQQPQVPQQAQVPQQPQVPQPGHAHHGDPQLLNPSNIAHEREHIQEHMDVPIDTSKMSEQELQFHYFKMHDADNNNKLDGCELIKSLIHWHGQMDKEYVPFSDRQIEDVVEQALAHVDLNGDGYVDYLEYKLSDLRAKRAKQEAEAKLSPEEARAR